MVFMYGFLVWMRGSILNLKSSRFFFIIYSLNFKSNTHKCLGIKRIKSDQLGLKNGQITGFMSREMFDRNSNIGLKDQSTVRAQTIDRCTKKQQIGIESFNLRIKIQVFQKSQDYKTFIRRIGYLKHKQIINASHFFLL